MPGILIAVMDKLIVVAPLCNHPSDGLAIRGLLIAVDTLHIDTLVEVSSSVKDLFYQEHRDDGLFDYVKYLCEPKERIEGYRLDLSHRYSFTVVASSIQFENVHNLIGQLVNLHKMLQRKV